VGIKLCHTSIYHQSLLNDNIISLAYEVLLGDSLPLRGARDVKVAEYVKKLNDMRRPECKDMATRLGVITADRIFLKNFPQRHPVTAFNPALLIRGERVHVYARLILGYYKYVSAVARIDFSLEDFEEHYVMFNQYSAELVVWPSNRYDIWGVEDPRVQTLGNKLIMIYAGRTCFYFSTINRERTVPVIATTEDPYAYWDKLAYFTLPKKMKERMITNKDVVLLETTDRLFVLHRPHLEGERLSLWIGEIPKEELLKPVGEEVKGLLIDNNTLVMEPAKFEDRVGWGAPLIKVGDDEWLAIIHSRGVDEIYRLIALTLTYDGDYPRISGVVPYYVMEPKEVYERFGDRPGVVFPCGAQKVKDKLLISYGAADSFVAFAQFSIDDLLSEMKPVE